MMIYLDHAATTPVHKAVIDAMYPMCQETFGNPSSLHVYGRKARYHLDEARRFLASSIHAEEREIIFTSGGTEGNNLALIGTALANQDKGNHIITSAQEHHATLHALQYLRSKGFHVTYLPVDSHGKINLDDLAKSLTNQTTLVTVMTANNETGVIQPIAEIGELLKEHQAYFHTDAVQAYSLLDINVKQSGIDLLTTSAHKLNGPKGIGFLYVGKHVPLEPLQYGGEQERKRRPGTENIVGAVGFHKAAQLAMGKKLDNYKRYETFRKTFLQELSNQKVEFQVNGELTEAIPNIVNISFPGTRVESLLTRLDLEGVAAASGSACTAGSIEPSHVLTAMYGKRDERIQSGIRFSFGSLNTKENVGEAAKRVAKVVKQLTN